MKKIISLVLFSMLTLLSFSQSKFYGVIGYGAAFKTFNNAYANYTKNNLPSDLTTLDYSNDRMLYSNWHIKMGSVSDWYLYDADITGALSFMSLAIYERITGKTIQPQNAPGIGRLKKIGENTTVGATAYGYDTNIFSLEFAVGAEGWQLGAYMGLSKLGTGRYSGTNPKFLDDKQTYIAMEDYGVGHLGLALHRVLGDDDRMSVISMRVNRLIHRWDDPYLDETIRRRGLELYPSARFFFGDRYGLYADIFYKYQRFGAFNTTDRWSNSPVEIEGVLPATSSHVFGINLGIFMPYI